MQNKKAQSAMEYLMTYGWAILVVVAVVAALYALGVFKSGTGAVKCSPCFTYFAYLDYSSGTVAFRNGLEDISITAVVTSPTALSVAAGGLSLPLAVTPGTTTSVTGISTTGQQTVTITYTVTASGLSHTDVGKINN